jgi:hypothetical protein
MPEQRPTFEDSAYAREQDALARQLETGEGPRRLRDEVQQAVANAKDPEVDPKIYEPVEEILFRGFITSKGEIQGETVVFKSINHHEFEQLSWVTQHDKQYHNFFLAYGVFIFGGVNVLSNRDAHLPRLIEFFDELPDGARRKLVRQLSEVNRRANNATTLTEAYALEQQSRFRWTQVHGLDLTSTAITGIEGTRRLGLNWGQLVWRALNVYEDQREEGERQWDNSKFVGGCLAGKGIQKVYNQDKERRKKEREERVGRKDRILRQIILGESPDQFQKAGIIVKGASTLPELVNQLEADLKGEKDWHDTVVAAEESRQQGLRQRQQDHLMELVAATDERFGDAEVLGKTDLTGLSREEVEARVQRKRQLEHEALAKLNYQPPLLDPRMEAHERKWGTYQKQDLADRDPQTALPVDPPRPPGTPFRRK